MQQGDEQQNPIHNPAKRVAAPTTVLEYPTGGVGDEPVREQQQQQHAERRIHN